MRITPALEIDTDDIEEITNQEIAELLTQGDWEVFADILNHYVLNDETNVEEIIDKKQTFPVDELSEKAKQFLSAILGVSQEKTCNEVGQQEHEEETYAVGDYFSCYPVDLEETYEVGDCFSRAWRVYRLCYRPANQSVALTAVHGNYYSWANTNMQLETQIKDPDKITKSEFKIITNNEEYKFKKITKAEAEEIVGNALN